MFVDSQDLWTLVMWLLVVNVVGNPPRIYGFQNILTCMYGCISSSTWMGMFNFGPFWIYVLAFNDFFVDSYI
jgi:hypothetical protein